MSIQTKRLLRSIALPLCRASLMLLCVAISCIFFASAQTRPDADLRGDVRVNQAKIDDLDREVSGQISDIRSRVASLEIARETDQKSSAAQAERSARRDADFDYMKKMLNGCFFGITAIASKLIYDLLRPLVQKFRSPESPIIID